MSTSDYYPTFLRAWRVLNNNKEISTKRLRNFTGVTLGKIHMILNTLEKMGFIERFKKKDKIMLYWRLRKEMRLTDKEFKTDIKI